MQYTRRFWGTLASGIVLATLALAFRQPVLLFGASSILGWLGTRLYVFYTNTRELATSLDLTAHATPTRVHTNNAITIDYEARVDTPPRDTVEITHSLPTGAAIAEEAPNDALQPLAFTPDTRTLLETVDVTFPFAGAYDLGTTEVTITDRGTLFETRWTQRHDSAVTVEPRKPDDLTIRRGTDQTPLAYGEHEVSERHADAGTVPAELREYTAGDPASRIDWRATARLTETYIREFEATSDETVSVLLDAKPSMQQGPTGKTKLDYLGDLALLFVDVAADHRDRLGYYCVDDQSLLARQSPAATPAHYARVRTTIRDRIHTSQATADPNDARGSQAVPPEEARRRAAVLQRDTSKFARRLTPFLRSTQSYVHRIEGVPLVETVRTYWPRMQGSVRTILLTDDADRAAVLETVTFARRRQNDVFVYLTPSFLFESATLPDVETAYERYLEFEQFRERLDRLARVHAYEVSPGRRSEALHASSESHASRSTESPTNTETI